MKGIKTLQGLRYMVRVMEIVGLCHICGGRAEHTCRMCGRPVCKKHYDSETGICDSCRHGKRVK